MSDETLTLLFQGLLDQGVGFMIHPVLRAVAEALHRDEGVDFSGDRDSRIFLVSRAFGDQTSLTMEPSYRMALLAYLRSRYPDISVTEDPDPPVQLRGKCVYLKRTDNRGKSTAYAVTLSGLTKLEHPSAR